MPSSSQNHPGVRPDRLLILPFTRRKFYESVSSSRESTNGIALRPESRRYRVCTASVRVVGVCVDGALSNLKYFTFLVPTETALERDYFMTGSWLLPWSPRRPTESLARSPGSPGVWYCRWHIGKETKVRRRKSLIQRGTSLNNFPISSSFVKKTVANRCIQWALQIRSRPHVLSPRTPPI